MPLREVLPGDGRVALPEPPSGESAGAGTVITLAAADAARSLARIVLRGRRRGPDRVAAEYDQGCWSGLLHSRRWETAPDLEQFLIGQPEGRASSRAVRHVGGRRLWLDDEEYGRWRIGAVQRLLDATAGGADELVELGCGYGANLFSLWLSGRWRRLVGLDVSSNAVTVGTSVTSRFGVEGVEFAVMDLDDAGDDAWARLQGATVLSYFCLEQLPSHLGPILDRLIAAAPARVVHVESAVGLLTRSRPLDLVNELYVRSMGYQVELVHRLDLLARAGRIRLVRRERLRFGPTIHNDPCLLVWEL